MNTERFRQAFRESFQRIATLPLNVPTPDLIVPQSKLTALSVETEGRNKGILWGANATLHKCLARHLWQELS
jgi:hypothetical protein